MIGALLYALISACIWYGLARAVLTQPIWSRFPDWLSSFTDCCACLSFWTSGLLALGLGRHGGITALGLDPHAWYYELTVAACGAVWTPLVAYLHQEALARLSGQSLLQKDGQ